MNHLTQLVGELRRRHVFRVAAGYVVAAWVLLQVADLAFESLELPGQALSYVWLALFLGFPVALVFGWRYDLTFDGIVRTPPADAGDTADLSLRRPDFMILGTLAIVVAAIAYGVVTRVSDIEADMPVAARLDAPPNSIAVLPFVNMSSDPEQEYFSDGISEELLNLLAKIPELRVISRSSAFSFKGKEISIPEVAEQLNVAHVLEGSVRKAGNQVRITAQLIDARSDTHLWSETYDRSLDDIFATQDEIAAEVVEQLKLTLLSGAPKVRETDPEAYALFLRARHLRLQETPEAFEIALQLYQEALAIDPDYPPAWEGLAEMYVFQTYAGMRPVHEAYRLAREAINKALAIDPDFGVAVAGLGWIAILYDHDVAAGARHFERALMLDPTNFDIISGVAYLAETIGRLDTAIAFKEYAVAHDPMGPVGHFDLANAYLKAGRLDDAIANLRIGMTLRPGHISAKFRLGMALLLKGEPRAALEAMEQETLEALRLNGLALAHHDLGHPAESDRYLNELMEQHALEASLDVAAVFAWRGEIDAAFEWLEKALENNDTSLFAIASHYCCTNLHDDPRWQPFLAKINKSDAQLAEIEFNVTPPE